MNQRDRSLHPYLDESAYQPLTRSFMSNIVLVVVLLSFTPMLLVSGLILDQYSVSHNDKLYAHLNEVVHRHSTEIDSFLNERLNNLRFLFESCGKENLFNNDFLEDKLFLLQQSYGDVFEDVGIVNEKGVQEFYAGKFKLEKAQYAHAQWLKEAFEKETFISDVFLGLRTSPHFIITVKNSYKGKQYLLKATINFDAFNSLAESLHIGKTGFAFILNKQGEFQTKPHYDMLPTNKSYPDFIKSGKESHLGTYVGTLEGHNSQDEIIYVASLLKNGEWILVFQQEKSEAYADLIHAQIVAVVLLFLGALIIVIMNVVLFRKVIKGIAKADMEKELMNRQVVESGKLASVGELAAGIAHEINNPVAIMVQEAGWIEDLLKRDEFERTGTLEEIESSLKQVYIQGKRCREITHKLLSFARKTSPGIQELDINVIILEVVDLTNMATYSNISINTALDNKLPSIYGSQTEVQQVIINLINNALHAIGEDDGKISIFSQLEPNYVLLVIEDNGPGIPEANLDRIFDPFFTTKPVGQGSGLGLSICYGIIKKMGGDIIVHSTVGEGTRFEVRFPTAKPKKPEDADLLTRPAIDLASIQNQKENVLEDEIKLLLVDDEKRFAKTLSKRLKSRNIDVTTTYSGGKAIQALRKVDFDVAILDLKMEDMDGMEVLKIFKKMYSDMAVIILSGHESQQAARACIRDGAFAYLAKPCDFEELVDTIKKAIY
jgi:two-component system NtrC family sensor kinase